MEILLAIIVLFFALWGLSDCLRLAVMRVLVPRDKKRRFIVPVGDIEGYYDLLSELELIRWHNERHPIVMIVDIGMDQETRQMCEKEVLENPFLILCKPEEVACIIQ